MFEYELIISISIEFPNQEIPKDVLIVQLLQHFSTCTCLIKQFSDLIFPLPIPQFLVFDIKR